MILDFNTADVEPGRGFTPLPPGEYKVVVQDAEGPIQTSDGNGSYLKIKLRVLEGECKDRVLFDNFNLWRAGSSDKDAVTIRIAQAKLRDLCLAVGRSHIKDTTELLNRPLIASAKIRDGGNYGLRNEIVTYKAINGGTTLDVVSTQQSGGKMAWE